MCFRMCTALNTVHLLLNDDMRDIEIHRDRMLDEMLSLYTASSELMLHTIRVKFVGEDGADLGGLTKDLFTSLWVLVLQTYFRGEAAVVPYLPVYKHYSLRSNYVAIGRILCHTVALLKMVPARLSRCFIMCLALGPNQVTDELLLADFRYSNYTISFFLSLFDNK